MDNIIINGIPARIEVEVRDADPLVWESKAKYQGLAMIWFDEDLLDAMVGEQEDHRRYAVSQRAIERKILKQVEGLETLDMVYRKMAGCSCGCSPAWTLPHHPGKIFFIDVKPVFAG